MYHVIGSARNRGFRVIWMLEEIGEPYEITPTKPRSEEVTRHYPAGKLPVMLDGDTVITDSVAIITYLADKHGKLTRPAGTKERAVQDGHTMFLSDEFESLLWTAARNTFILPEERRVPEIKETLKWEYERSLERLEHRLGDGRFLMGETMTIPDILAGHCSRWAEVAKFPEPSERLAAYFTSLRNRPAYQRANEG